MSDDWAFEIAEEFFAPARKRMEQSFKEFTVGVKSATGISAIQSSTIRQIRMHQNELANLLIKKCQPKEKN